MKLKQTVFLSVLIISMLTGCGAASNPSSNNPTATASVNSPGKTDEADKEREHLKISVYFPMHPTANLEDIPEGGYMLDKQYEEKFNITLDMRYVPNTNAGEMYNIMMASGDIPDLVKQDSWTDLHKYKDAWWDLSGLISEKYPNLEKAFLEDDYVYTLSKESDGQLKILSWISEQYIGDVLMVRGDLVDKWGINMSDYKTKEDYIELFKLVKEKDPTIIPYMTRYKTGGLIQRLCEGWSGIKQYVFFDLVDSQVKYGSADPRMKEVIQYLNLLYKEGLIDQEFPTSDTAKWQEKVLNTGVFITHDNASSRIKWISDEFAKLGVTDKYYEAIPPLQPDAGTKGYTTIHYPRLRSAAAIYKGASKEKVERLLEIFEYNLSEEGFMLTNYGIEGLSYTIGADGQVEDIPEYRKAYDAGTLKPEEKVLGDFASIIKIEPNAIYLPQNRPYTAVIDAAKLYEDGGLIQRNWIEAIRFTDEEQRKITQLEADIKTYTDEMLDQFIMGVKPMSEWDSFVAGYSKLKLDEYLNIYNDAMKRALSTTGK